MTVTSGKPCYDYLRRCCVDFEQPNTCWESATYFFIALIKQVLIVHRILYSFCKICNLIKCKSISKTCIEFYKLDSLKRKESLTQVQVLHYLGGHAPPPQRWWYVDINARILRIVDDCPNLEPIYYLHNLPIKSTNHVSIPTKIFHECRI